MLFSVWQNVDFDWQRYGGWPFLVGMVCAEVLLLVFMSLLVSRFCRNKSQAFFVLDTPAVGSNRLGPVAVSPTAATVGPPRAVQ